MWFQTTLFKLIYKNIKQSVSGIIFVTVFLGFLAVGPVLAQDHQEKLASDVPIKVAEGMKDVVRIEGPIGTGSGFIVRDKKTNEPVLITAHHVMIRMLTRDLSFEEVSVFTHKGKQLKIKGLRSYSREFDVFLLNLESYEGSGLRLADSPVYNKNKVYALGYPSGKFQQVEARGFHHKSNRDFNLIEEDYEKQLLGGASGGPVLNSVGEVIGLVQRKERLYIFSRVFYGVALTVGYLKDLLNNPFPPPEPGKLLSLGKSYLKQLEIYHVMGDNLLSEQNSIRLQQMAKESSSNAQHILAESKKVLQRSFIAGGSSIIISVISFTYLPELPFLSISGGLSSGMIMVSCRDAFKAISLLRNK